MLSEPQSITLATGAKVTNRVLNGTRRGEFIAPDATARVEVETTHGQRVRTVIRVEERKIAPDPLTAVNQRLQQHITLTLNRPSGGFSEADVLASVKGVLAWLTASSDAVLKKIIAGEN